MIPIKQTITLYILLLLFVLLYNVECKKRHHRHKKVVTEGEETPVTVSTDVAPATPSEERPNLTYATPESTASNTQYYTSKNVDSTQQNNANTQAPAAQTTVPKESTKENVQKSETEQKEKETYKWTNHTIPFLKRFRKEIDGGRIKHHNYEEMTWFLKYFAEEFPDITRLYSIGELLFILFSFHNDDSFQVYAVGYTTVWEGMTVLEAIFLHFLILCDNVFKRLLFYPRYADKFIFKFIK